MSTTKIFLWGLIASFIILLVSAGSMLWPLIATPRFWLTTGFVVGIVGTFFFTVALSSVDNQNNQSNEKQS